MLPTTQTHFIHQLIDPPDKLAERVQLLCAINSGTSNQEGVGQVADIAEGWLLELADDVSRVKLPNVQQIDDSGAWQTQRFCHALLASKRPNVRRRALLNIHLDTVYGLDHSFQTVERPDDNTLHGPGVADAKGGLVVMLAALDAFEQLPGADAIGWDVLLNPDEEIGSPASTGLLQETARLADLGMVFEPCLPDGGMIHQRKGSANFSVVIRGRAAHAGREISRGRNAISVLSRLLIELTKLQTDDERITVNPGRVIGGGPVNVVPDLAIGRFNIRCTDHAEMQMIVDQLSSLISAVNLSDGIGAMLHGGFSSPPKTITPATQKFIERIRRVSEGLSLPLSFHSSGGVCDGNKIAAVGLPTIDTLGPRGGHIHSDREYLVLNSLAERTALSAAVLYDFAKHPEHYPKPNRLEEER